MSGCAISGCSTEYRFLLPSEQWQIKKTIVPGLFSKLRPPIHHHFQSTPPFCARKLNSGKLHTKLLFCLYEQIKNWVFAFPKGLCPCTHSVQSSLTVSHCVVIHPIDKRHGNAQLSVRPVQGDFFCTLCGIKHSQY